MLKFLQNTKLFLRLGDGKQHGFPCCFQNAAKFYSSVAEQGENDGLDINALTQGNPELEHKFKVLQLEAEVMRQEGRNVPEPTFLKTFHWQELMKLQSRSARQKYLDFLFKTEKKKENEQLKKERKRLERKEQQKDVEPVTETDHLKYVLGQNHIFLRFYDTTINDLYNWKLMEAMQFGQKLIVDCGYDKHMTTRESINCAKQLMLLFAENRAHEDPFDLHFCNANLQSILMTSLHRHIKTMYEPWFPLSLHERSYRDIFPADQLIYLTPHCKEEMKTYDYDAIYIIGGMVDKVNNEPVSFAKAKQEGLRMAKLPLDRYLEWGSGAGKSLTLNQVASILLDIKRTGDWKFALRHVPKRKLVDVNSNEIQTTKSDNNRNRKYFFSSDSLNLRYNKQRQKRMHDIKSIFNE